MTRFRLTVEFDGRPFMGWQRQRHGPSVQEALETVVHEITGETCEVYGAGRTDAGVHATAMVAHVDIEKPLTPFRLMEAMNARLRLAGMPVAILEATVAEEGFHARFSCKGRRYRYVVVCRRAPLTHEAGLAWRRPHPLNIGRMRDAASQLVGRHDFTTFRHVHCQASSPVRTLDELSVHAEGDHVFISAGARSFLHHQVRSMVGALVTVGEQRWSADDVGDALRARNRALLPINAPACGLWFIGAAY